MSLAWATSILAQLVLAVSLWRSGRRDWWLGFLVADLIRSALLLPLHGSGRLYYWTWTGTWVILMGIQIAACLERAAGRWSGWWVGMAASGAFWIAAFTPNNADPYVQFSLMLWQGTAFVCLALLLSAGVRSPMTYYYGSLAITSSLAQFALSREWSETIRAAQLCGSTIIFAAWAALLPRGVPVREGGVR